MSTEKRELDAQMLQMEKLASIGRLVAGFSHEVRNPLMAIKVQTEALAASTGDAKIHERLVKIGHATKRIESLVKNLLSFARASKNTVGPIDIRTLLDTSLELILLEDKWKQVEIVKKFEPEIPWTFGNVNTIMQVFLNLMMNALQAMEGRSGSKLRLEVRRSDDGKSVLAEIIDNGPGVPSELQSKIFEPFFTTKGKQGTGLGLSIVKDIIISHGGKIELVSKPGQGARFKVSLPAEDRAH